MLNKKRILVTGGGGLVGSAINFISDSYPQYDLFFTNHKEHDLTQQSVVKELFENVKPNYVIHTAAFVGGIGRNLASPAQQFYKNILMNSFVTHYSYLTGVEKLISFSSICAFPQNVSEINENVLHDGAPHKSYFSYAYSKRMVDVQNQAYNQEYGTSFTTIIPGNIYGERDNFNLDYGHVIPSLIHKCYLAKRDNKPFKIWGDGSALREFLYSEDVARVTLELLNDELDLPPTIIVSSREEIQIKKVVKMICDAFDYHHIVWETEKPNGQYRRPTNKHILNTLLPEFIYTDLKTGINKTVDWFNNNFPNLRF